MTTNHAGGVQTMDVSIKDVRAEMPNYEQYRAWQRDGDILGIAIHHSATVDRTTGGPVGDAQTFFDYHVNTLGWAHGGYNYIITGQGVIEYALDEKIAAYHAGFKDVDNSEGLEFGQYWNNHYLAICLSGWFAAGRTYRDSDGVERPIPNNYITPSPAQSQALFALIQQLRRKYNIPVENVRGHRELPGNSTHCPGQNLDPATLRAQLRAADEADPTPEPPIPPEIEPGQHVMLLPDTDKYMQAALTYVWKFQPDVSFAADAASGRWDYVTAVGNSQLITDNQLAQLRQAGAKLVQRIAGDPTAVRSTLDQLVEQNMRFHLDSEPEPEERFYTVQPGDSLSAIAKQLYGRSGLWTLIFEANQDLLSSPSQIRPGQRLRIPPAPASK